MASGHIKTVRGKTRTSYVVRYRPGGRSSPTRHAGSFPTKKLAQDRLDVVLEALAKGREPVFEVAASERVSVAAAFDRYEAGRLDWSEGSVKIFRQAKARLGKLGRRDSRSVVVEDVQAWVKALLAGGPKGDPKPLAVASVRKYLDQLRVVLDEAGLEPNPSRSPRVKLPKQVVEEIVPPTAGEVAVMCDELRRQARTTATRRYPLVCELLVGTGLRIGELQQVTWGDFDRVRGRLRVARNKTKGRTSGRRFVPLPGRLVASLAELRGDAGVDEAVFPGLSDNGLRSAMERACDRAGIPVYSPHDLRHRWISLLVMAGVPVSRVAGLAGHGKSSLTLDVYSHVMMDESEDVLDEMRRLAA